MYFTVTLAALELLLAPFSSLYPTYSDFIGIAGLSIEATLPMPQPHG